MADDRDQVFACASAIDKFCHQPYPEFMQEMATFPISVLETAFDFLAWRAEPEDPEGFYARAYRLALFEIAFEEYYPVGVVRI